LVCYCFKPAGGVENRLRQQAAIYALGETPLHLVNKIEYEEERIAELKAELDYDFMKLAATIKPLLED